MTEELYSSENIQGSYPSKFGKNQKWDIGNAIFYRLNHIEKVTFIWFWSEYPYSYKSLSACQKFLSSRNELLWADLSSNFQRELTTAYVISGMSYIIAIMEFFCKISVDTELKLERTIES